MESLCHIPALGMETAAHDMGATIAADLPALHLQAGQHVTLRPVAAVDADAIFAFQDGTLARVQSCFDGTYQVTASTGASRIIARADLPPVTARLIRGHETQTA
jgi:hypothetical protein